MVSTIKYVVENTPSEILFLVLIIFFILEYKELRQLKKLIKVINKDYKEHINKSVQSDREMLRGKLRRLHLEIDFTIQAQKIISEQVIEEFYSAYDLYVKLGGNGYIKKLKEEVDDWLSEQRKNRRLK